MTDTLHTIIGLMAGTSLDGIDVAVLETDGETHHKLLWFKTYAYDDALRQDLMAIKGNTNHNKSTLTDLNARVTIEHANACQEALAQFPQTTLIGFHGQTIWHDPDHGRTCQLGDGQLLANLTQRNVVYDFRSHDMNAGGQGAPLLPYYHFKKSQNLSKPIAVLNIGGVSNITYINYDINDIMGFDCGTGNGFLDEWIQRHTNKICDVNGAVAAQGQPDQNWIEAKMAHPYFAQKPPKSLDRDTFSKDFCDWSLEDGAATLTHFSACAIARSLDFLPQKPDIIAVTGGGRHNPTLIKAIEHYVRDTNIKTVENLGWNGDALEAEAFACYALCHINKTPITYPSITGCYEPIVAGTLCEPQS